MSVIANLRKRGLVHDVSHEAELDQLFARESVTYYCGFDPTADSLHVGSMLPLITMKRLQDAGHKPIVILGSATGMIGDPSGKSQERNLLNDEQLDANLRGMEKQFQLFLKADGKNGFKILKNHEWTNNVTYIDFLRDIGKHFTVNMMIAKDSVKSRLENREQGISYTEFSYMLLQAFDFWHLYEKHGCRLQVGGSDQWGNITAGTELIRRKTATPDKQAYAMTFPLLTTSSGQKFGKTAEGAVWLDAKRTSPYKFFQYWLNSMDADVGNYIKLFTEADGEELSALENSIKSAPEKREAQRYLARTLTTLVHGKEEADRSEKAAEVLFGGDVRAVDAKTLLDIFSEVPSTSLTKAEITSGVALTDLLVKTKLADSKGAAKRLIEGGGLYLNSERESDVAATVNLSRFIDNRVLVVRSGKKNYHLVVVA